MHLQRDFASQMDSLCFSVIFPQSFKEVLFGARIGFIRVRKLSKVIYDLYAEMRFLATDSGLRFLLAVFSQNTTRLQS